MDARKIKPISNHGKCPRRRKWFAYSPTYCTEGGCPESKKCPFPDEYGKPLKK